MTWQQHADRWGYVYFAEALQADGRIKIGFSQRPKQRVQALGSKRTIRLIAFAPATQIAERVLHKQFAAKRVCREWFARDQALLDLVEQVAACAVLPATIIQEALHENAARFAAWREKRMTPIKSIRPPERAAA